MTLRQLTTKYNYICKCIEDFVTQLSNINNSVNQIIVSNQPTQHEIIADSVFDLPNTESSLMYITYSGNTNGTATLPALEDSEWKRWIIINHGTGILTLVTDGNDNDIYSVSGNVSTLTIDPGVTIILYNNSIDFSNIQ